MASGGSLASVANAASISRLLLALRTWTCSPMTRAAGSMPLNVDSADAHGHTCRAGHQLTQQLEPLRRQFSREKIDPRQVAARAGKAGDNTKLDRVFSENEDDGDCRGCRLGRAYGRDSPGCDHSDPSLHQVRRQRRQPIDLIVGPAVFDGHVLALGEARVFQALAECTQAISVGR